MSERKAYNITGSGIVLDSPGLYYGFTCVAGGHVRNVQAWDSPTTNAGTKVENYTISGVMMGKHDLGDEPVYLENGLYVGLDGGTAIIYAWKNPLQG